LLLLVLELVLIMAADYCGFDDACRMSTRHSSCAPKGRCCWALLI
jgi:hypothetical protein